MKNIILSFFIFTILGSSEPAFAIIDTTICPIINLEVHKNYSCGIGYKIKDKGTKNIFSMEKGRSISFSDDPNNFTNLGKFIILEHSVLDSAHEKHLYFTLYAMLSKLKISKIEEIKSGIIIGEGGPSGPLSKITDDEVFIGAYSLRQDRIIETYLKSKSEFMHNVYWYNITNLLENTKKK